MPSYVLVNIYAPILGYLDFEPYAIAESANLAAFVDESGAEQLFWDYDPADLFEAGLHVWEPNEEGPIVCNLGDPEMLAGSLRRATTVDLEAIETSEATPSGPDRLFVCKHASAPAWLLNFDVGPASLPGLDVIQSLQIDEIVFFGDETIDFEPGIWCVEGDFVQTCEIDDEIEAEFGFEHALAMLDGRGANVRRVTAGELRWLLEDCASTLANMDDNTAT